MTDDTDDETEPNKAGILAEVVPGLTEGLPLPPAIRKSLWKSLSALITGTADIGVAYLESVSQNIRMDSQTKKVIEMGAAKAVADLYSKDSK